MSNCEYCGQEGPYKCADPHDCILDNQARELSERSDLHALLAGYCDSCDSPISTKDKRLYDLSGNMVCSEYCQRENNFDFSRDS